jgi:hypothetical protein
MKRKSTTPGRPLWDLNSEATQNGSSKKSRVMPIGGLERLKNIQRTNETYEAHKLYEI